MNVNGLNNNNLIDVQSVNQTAQDIWNSLSNKTVDYSKLDLSKFNRQKLGVDFYSQKTDIGFERQVTMINSGAFDVKLNLNSVKNLNTLAALGAYSDLSQTVGGKMTINAPESNVEFVSRTEDVSSNINVFETDKDKKGSNPFYFGQPQSKEPENEDV